MSQILAVINGPAFCPLPGIGRVWPPEEPEEVEEPKVPANEFGILRRAAIVEAIRQGHNTRKAICAATGIPYGSIDPHMRKLLANKEIRVVQEAVIGHKEATYGVKK